MALKDLVFGLGLKSDKFDAGMKAANAELKKFAATRLTQLTKEMKEAGALGGKLASVKMKPLIAEYKTLQNAIKATTGENEKLHRSMMQVPNAVRNMGGRMSSVMTGIFQGVGQQITSIIASSVSRGVAAAKSTITQSMSSGAMSRGVEEAQKTQLAANKEHPAWANALGDEAESGRRRFKFMDDEEFKKAQTALLRAGMPAKSVAGQTQTIADLAAARGMSGEEAGATLGKIFRGQGRVFRELGIDFKASDDPTKVASEGYSLLQKTFAGQGEAKARTMGPTAGAESAWGEIKENLGKTINARLEGPMTRLANVLEGFLKSPDSQNTFKRIMDAVETSAKWIIEMAQTMQQVWGKGEADVKQDAADKIAASFGGKTRGQLFGEAKNAKQKMRDFEAMAANTLSGSAADLPEYRDAVLRKQVAEAMFRGERYTVPGSRRVSDTYMDTIRGYEKAGAASAAAAPAYSPNPGASPVAIETQRENEEKALAKKAAKSQGYADRYNQRQQVDVNVTSMDDGILAASAN